MLTWLWIAAIAVLAFLSWSLYRRFGADRIGALNDKRRPTSRFVSRGEFIDGSRHMEVALALTTSALFYENADMEASIDLEWVSEIEYDTQLSTGRSVEDGKVLRFRCHSKSFEFILPNDVVARWQGMLPPRRANDDAVIATPTPAAVAAA